MSDVEKFVRFCTSDFGRRILEREAEYINRELRDSKSILDVGCGIGQFEQKLSNLNITGLDTSTEMLEEAKRRSHNNFVLDNAEHLDFVDGSFEAVLYVTSLEFLDNYQRAIQEAWRVTKPDGRLLAMILNPSSEYFNEQIQREGSYFSKAKHNDLDEIRNHILRYYHLSKSEYFLGIRGQRIFDTTDKRFASLYVISGCKKI